MLKLDEMGLGSSTPETKPNAVVVARQPAPRVAEVKNAVVTKAPVVADGMVMAREQLGDWVPSDMWDVLHLVPFRYSPQAPEARSFIKDVVSTAQDKDTYEACARYMKKNPVKQVKPGKDFDQWVHDMRKRADGSYDKQVDRVAMREYLKRKHETEWQPAIDRYLKTLSKEDAAILIQALNKLKSGGHLDFNNHPPLPAMFMGKRGQ